MDVQVNYLAVLLAAVASMIVGFLWYSPMVLGKPWMQAMGLSEKSLKEMQKKMGPMYALSFVGALVMAYVLTHIMALSANFYHYPMVQTGLMSAFWSWFGFVAPVQMTEVIFGGKTWKLFAINTGYQLASLLVMGLVLSMF